MASLESPRILVIRRNRLGDMICTLPLLHALKAHFPQSKITVACDRAGAAIAQASGVVENVYLLKSGWNRRLAALWDALHLQNFDYVLAVKGGYDGRLEWFCRLTRATKRIGYVEDAEKKYPGFTHPVLLSAPPHANHQVETQLHLLKELGIEEPALKFDLKIPEKARRFADEQLNLRLDGQRQKIVLINLSSTVTLKFSARDFQQLIQLCLEQAGWRIGLVYVPQDQGKAEIMRQEIGSDRVLSLPTPTPLDLAALFQRAAVLVTPEGGAAHLAAATQTPAIVLWSEGPFQKWHSRHPRHYFIREEAGKISVDQVWETLYKEFLS